MSFGAVVDAVLTFFRRLFSVARPVLTRRFVYGYIYSTVRDKARIRPRHALLESYHGTGLWGSPHALLQHMADIDTFDGWTFVLVAPRRQRRYLKKRFPELRISFVQPRSVRYAWHLATCKWLINDVTFPLYFSRRDEQRYLNLWHGTPLKTLGRDAKRGMARQIANVQRNFLHATHLLAPNLHTETVLREAYMLEGQFAGQVIQCGYPRNDVLVKASEARREGNVHAAFMPTWRGTLETRSRDSCTQLRQLGELLDKLDASLAPHATLWVRLHPLIAGKLSIDHYRRIKPFPQDISPYEHLASCDLLVTDYSSVLFDFALTGRPIVLYTPDMEHYGDERGFYIQPNNIPLPQVDNPDALADLINRARTSPPLEHDAYRDFFHPFGEREHGDSCERICNTFFDLPAGERAPITCWSPCPRRNILLYTGAPRPNGITQSFKTLLRLIDTSKHSFIVLADTGYDAESCESFLNDLPEEIGFVPLILHPHIGPLEMVRVAWIYLFRRKVKEAPDIVVRIWQRELRRLLAVSAFDAFVNFNGYSWRAALLALGANWRRIVYVHNDMALEVDANKILDERLLELSYRTADRIALVREGVETDYCRRFYDYREKSVYTPNSLQPDIGTKAQEPLFASIHVRSAPGLLERLEHMLAKERVHRFVNLARFGGEKGQVRLIEAFERLHATHPNTQLFIVGGYGPLLSEIERQASRSSARNSICVVLGSTNPFPLASRCDTLVLSSFYEGIGLVLFESLQLGLRVVSTDIPGPREFLHQGYGLVVENSREGLFEGMKSALAGDVPFRAFDLRAHNRAAVTAFESLFH